MKLALGDGGSGFSEFNALPGSTSLFSLPGYQVHGEIARGGMGIVYRARQLEPAREVALKMLLPHQIASPSMLERFRLEARAIATLEHPAILPVHQVGEHNGLPFFTMKLATGGTLAERRDRLAGDGRAIAELVATLADAVQFAHERGVLHRDLKPANVLFDEAGRVYVSDFGLAKLTGTDSGLTRSVEFLGTPHYVAPEVAARSAKDATTSSDIYSLGAILYELLAGRPPFEADGIPALLKKIAQEEPETPAQVRASLHPHSKLQLVPRDLEVICLKCLAKEPWRRYATALELATDLRRWLAGEPILARETNAFERLWLWSCRHRITAGLITAVIVLLAALVVVFSIAAVRVVESRRAALRTVEALETQKANDLFATGNTADAIALLARRVRANPGNWADCARLMWSLQRRRWAVPSRPPVRFTEATDRTFLVRRGDGRLLALFVGTNLVVHDVFGGTNRHVWALPFQPERLKTHEESGLLVLVDGREDTHFLEYETGRLRELPLNVRSGSVQLDKEVRWAFVVAPDYSGSLVDMETGQTRRLAPNTESSRPGIHPIVQFFNDDRRLAVFDRDRTVRIFERTTGVTTGHIFTAAQPVMGLSISPDDRVLAAVIPDAVQFWDVETGRELPAPSEVGVSFRPGAFGSDGSQYYHAGNASGLVLFDPLKGQISRRPSRGPLLNGVFHRERFEGRVSVRFGRFVGIFDGASGEPLCQPLPVAHSTTCNARFVEDQCATVSAEGALDLWKVRTNRFAPIVLRHAGAVQFAQFSSDGRRVITASHDGTSRVWDTVTGQAVGEPLQHRDKVWSACFSPDGRRVGTGSWDGSARLWDTATGAALSPPLRAGSYIFHVEFSPDGSRFLASGEDRTVRIYDSATGRLLQELKEEGPVYWAHFSPDGRTIVTRPLNAHARIWHVETGKVIRQLAEPGPHRKAAGVVTRGDFSRDRRWLALGSANGYATVWHLPDGKLHAVLNHVAAVRTAVFSPDSRTILTTADDLTGQLWDLSAGQALSSPLGHQIFASRPNTGNALRGGAIHPDGRRTLTGGSDGTARLWNLENGLSLGEPAELEGSVMHAEFSPDGRQVLIACYDGTAQIVAMPPVVERAPDWLAPLAEALVGQRFDSKGATQIVSPSALWEVCQRIEQAPASEPGVAWVRQVLGQ
ncbi:MAG TPA: protein kinase [Verrucomicrobiae bacterium]|nr:protein kinase [Verrucomicrobiae bacterium]